MYVAKFEKAIYGLHSFQKATRRTSQRDVGIATARYRAIVADRNAAR
jgi:phage-related protein